MQDSPAQLAIQRWVSLSQLVNPEGSFTPPRKAVPLKTGLQFARIIELEASERGAPIG
jgi:hypothetical protein